MNLPAAAPRFAGVYTFERRQADGSTTPLTPEALNDDGRLQVVLQARMADAEKNTDSLTSVTRLVQVGDRLVGVAGVDLAAILESRSQALYTWIGLSGKRGVNPAPSAYRVAGGDYSRIEALADEKCQQEGPAAQQAVAALEQGVLQAYLAKHPPTPLILENPPDAL